ncbi:MAG: hypothetical protein RL757_2482 [Bacteroidota bacterium]|jgi:hypothetical protein
MKKRILNLLTVVSIVFLSGSVGCDPEPVVIEPVPTTIPMKILMNYKNTPLIVNKNYALDDSTKVRFSRINFFLTNISAGTITGQESKTESMYFDFSNLTDSAKAANGVSQNLEVSKGTTYDRIIFTVGVSTLLNARKPASFPLASALSNTDEYWSSWNSFIFVKLEGALDKNNDGIFESPFTLHTGGNDVAKEKAFLETISGDNAKGVKMALKMEDILGGVSLRSVSSAHGVDQLPLMKTITSNIANGLRFE